jgi:transposase
VGIFGLDFNYKSSDDPLLYEEDTNMARYKITERDQGKFIPVCFDIQIQPGTFEFTLDYLIDNKVDLSVFDKEYRNDETGAPAYNPAVLLKIVLLAYSRGIFTSREIAYNCESNVIFMAISGNTQPHFTTIAYFISSMENQVKSVFTDVLMYCDEVGLIGKNMFAIDGCKLPSNASKEWSGTHKSFQNKLKKMRKAITYILKKHRDADYKETVSDQRQREEQYIKTLNKQIEKIENFLIENKDKIGKQGKPIKSNITDNESAYMKTSKGVIQGYDAVVAVDDQEQIIVHAEAFGTGQEHDLLEPTINSVKENLNSIGHKGDIRKKAKWTADAGFHCKDNMKMLFENNIDAYVADNEFRKRDPKFANIDKYKERHRNEMRKKNGNNATFSTKDFKFADDLSYCICPAGKRLYRNGGNTYTDGHHSVRFRGPKCHCLPCPLRSKCLRNPKGNGTRQVAFFTGKTKGADSGYIKQMKVKIDSEKGRAIYSKRIGTVEPVFANIRHALGLDRFTLRGKIKVNTQLNLYAILHNMLKLHRYGIEFDTG